MGLLIVLALLAVPAVEIAIFVKVGGLIGLWPTLGLIFATAIAGAVILRSQGLSTLARARAQLAQGALPVDEMLNGLVLMVAAFALITPGFATDFAGALLLVPPLRRLALRGIKRHFALHLAGHVAGAGPRPHGGITIEGDYEDVTPAESSSAGALSSGTTDPRNSARAMR